MRKSKSRFTFAEVSHLTSTEADAIAFAEQLRWRGKITCRQCASTDVARLGGRPGRYRCRACARQFSIRTGTPMECSRLPIATWLRALWLVIAADWCTTAQGLVVAPDPERHAPRSGPAL